MTNEEAIIDIRENIQPIVGGKSLDIAISALDLITHQQAELENLKVENQSLRSAANSLKMHYEEARAEIERLQEYYKMYYDRIREIKELQDETEHSNYKISLFDETIKTAKSEAYKECLTKVKNYIKTHCNPYGKPDFDYDTSIKILNFIDNLVKEMVVDDSNDK